MAHSDIPQSRHRSVRYTLLAIGWLSVLLGVIGIFVPVNHQHLGPWIRDYLEGNGIPLKGKVYAIGLMWASIGLSCYLVPMPWARAFMLTSAVLVTLYILRQKTLPARD